MRIGRPGSRSKSRMNPKPAFHSVIAATLLWCCGAVHAENYTIPLFVGASAGGDPQGVLKLVNGAEAATTVAIHSIDDTGVRAGPTTLTLNALASMELSATELRDGSTAKGLSEGLGSLAGDVRLLIVSDAPVLPSAFVRSADGALSAVNATVLEAAGAGRSVGAERNAYRYDVAVFHPASHVTQPSRLRLINPNEVPAQVAIDARDDAGTAASGGTVQLTVPPGGARTLTSRQLEAGDSAAFSGRLGAGVGNWRLSVSADRPIQVVNVAVGAATGYWSNLSTTAVDGWAPQDAASFEARFLDRRIVSRDGQDRLELRIRLGNRFRDVGIEDGVEAIEEGRYRYERRGRDAGRLSIEYDSGEQCESNLYFASPMSGWYASRCIDAVERVEGSTGGLWVTLDAAATALDLGSGPDNRTYTAGTAIDALTLPGASGGDGEFTYSLSPEVPGLRFDPDTRRLTGTPSEAGDWLMTYRVRDASGDTDWRYFTIDVDEGTDEAGSLGTCHVGQTVGVGQSCTYPGTTEGFSVNARGRGAFLGRLAGIRIDVSNESVDGRVYDFRASHQGDGVWRIDRIAGSTEPPTDGGGGGASSMFGVGDTLSDLPTGSWTPDVTSGGSFSSSGDTATVRLNEGGYIEEGEYRYTCRSSGGCMIENRRVTSGTVVQTSSGTAPGDTGTGQSNDRAALMALYNGTNGPNWAGNANWGSSAPLSQWHGVTTDNMGRVTEIDLYGNRLSGPIPVELGNLSNLRDLFLGGNQLSGSIPVELGNLSNLHDLFLGDNQLSGSIPIELGSLSNLIGLGLSQNQLSGPIPAELGSLSSLEELYLWGNELSGPIPVELGKLSNLQYLNLNRNQLSGPIPVELGSLSNLLGLGLSQNQLSGPIPAELGNLSNLQYLSLGDNQLSGCIPDGLRDVEDNDLSALGLANCGDAGTPGGGQETTFGVGDTLSDLPIGIWTPDVTSGGSFLLSGGTAIVRLNEGGYIEEDNYRYTCQSFGGCVIENRSVASGTIVQTASGTVPGGGTGQGGRPGFPAGSGPSNQTYTVGTAITALTLPAASGGDGALTYSLSPVVPGLMFNATATVRRLSGTPTTAGTYDMIYTVRDVDGDTDSLMFTISVEDAADSGPAGSFDLHNDNSNARGITHVSGRFYVVDSREDKVYAYTETGARDASADIELYEDNSDPWGIAYANGRFYVVDWSDDKVYAYTDTGGRDAPAEFNLHEDNSNARGIAHANDQFFVVDWSDDKVYAYTERGERDASAEFDLHRDNWNAGGIAHANDGFYVVNLNDDRVYAYTETGGRDVNAEFELRDENSTSQGIAHANDRFYIVDWTDQELYVYSFSDQRVLLEFNLHDDNSNASGIAHANGRFYVLDDYWRGQKVYAYTETGARDASADFDLHDDNSSPERIGYANGRFYVVDQSDDKVYAYTETGARDSSADFDLHDDNSYPTGIAHANGRFYVVDRSDDQVYAYTETGDHDEQADFDLHYPENLQAEGIAFANGRLHVVDHDDNVYAYWSHSGQRDASAEFELHDDHWSPEGIAYNNGRFYIVDSVNNRIYSYPETAEPDGPDLMVDSAAVSAGELSAGASYTLSAIVRNRGNRPSAATTLRYFRSSDPIISATDTEIGTDAVGGLSAGATGNESITLTAPSQNDCYYCGACVDTVDGESTTSNNCSNPVLIAVGEQADIAVSRTVLNAPSTGTVGVSRISMTVDVTNRGQVASLPSKLIFSGGVTISVDIPELSPGETMTFSRDVGTVRIGTSTYRACVDFPCDTASENNCQSRSVTYL